MKSFKNTHLMITLLAIGGLFAMQNVFAMQYLASGSDDKTVKIWDAKTGKLIRTLEGHTKPVYAVAFHQNNPHIVASGTTFEGTVRVWDLRKPQKKEQISIKRFEHPITLLAFHPEKQNIIAAVQRDWSGITDDNVIKIWNTSTGEDIATLKNDGDRSILSIDFNKINPNLIVSGTENGILTIWDISKPEGQKKIKQLSLGDSVNSVAFSLRNPHIVALAMTQDLQVWDISKRPGKNLIRSVRIPIKSRDDYPFFNTVKFDRKNPNIIVFGITPIIGVFDMSKPIGKELVKKVTSASEEIVIDPENLDTIASISDTDNKVIKIQKLLATKIKDALALKGHTGAVRSMAFSPTTRSKIEREDEQERIGFMQGRAPGEVEAKLPSGKKFRLPKSFMFK